MTTPTLDLTKPVVWTTLGNMNECDLDQFIGGVNTYGMTPEEITARWREAQPMPFKIDWVLAQRDDMPGVLDHVVFAKEWYYRGKMIKREPHIYMLRGSESAVEHGEVPK